MYDRVPIQLATFLSTNDIPTGTNLLVLGDYLGRIGGYETWTHSELAKTSAERQPKASTPKDGEEVKQASSSKGWKVDAKKNLPGFKELYERSPRQDWYFMFDDDTWVNWPNMLLALENMPENVQYLGNGNVFVGCGGVKKFGEGPVFAHGGSGILLSHSALSKMAANETVYDSCIKKYWDCFAGDIQVALCLDRELGIRIAHPKFKDGNVYTFGADNPFTKRYGWTEDPCKRPITFHHILPQQMQKFYDIQSNFPKHQPITFGDFFQFIHGEKSASFDGSGATSPVGKYYIQPDKGHSWGFLKNEPDAKTLEQCLESCEKNLKCHTFAFNADEKKCHLHRGISMERSQDAKGWTTGIIPAHYVCQK